LAWIVRREDSPDDISRGLFAGEVGAPRLLKLFERMQIKTTWFIPGHSIETFPEQMQAVAAAGHEIGVHGYSHENPIAMTRQQEADVLDSRYSALADVRFGTHYGLKSDIAPCPKSAHEQTWAALR
jgi:hypothetical protein